MRDIEKKQTFFNISVELKRLGDVPTIRFIEIVGDDIRYRVAPKHDFSLEGSLDRRLAKFVENHLRKISRPRMVVHEPEATVELPHLTLSNLQTLVSVTDTRAQLALVRFTGISGNPLSALRASVENVGSSIQNVAINAYEHVFQSGVALIEANNINGQSVEDRPELHLGRKRLDQNIEKLLFNLDILKRHVSRAKAEPDLPHRGSIERFAPHNSQILNGSISL